MGAAVEQLLASKVLNETEALILLNEGRSPVLSHLPEDDFHDAVIDLISEIKIITGAIMYPDGSPEQFAQLECFKRLLLYTPRYRGLNAGDVSHAFYMNAAGMFPEKFRHYNRELNAEFLGDVLNAFVAYKDAFLGNKLAKVQKALNPAPEPAKQAVTLDDWKRLINQDIFLLKVGRLDLVWNCSAKYLVLRKLGYIQIGTKALWWKWYQSTISDLRSKLFRRATSNEGEAAEKKTRLKMYGEILRTGEVPTSEHPALVAALRRNIYLWHLRELAATGIDDLFSQVQP